MTSTRSTPHIVIELGPAGRLEHALARGTTTIGRRVDNDVRLDDPTVSGHHAEIIWVYEAPYLQDLGSTNGTFVNDRRVGRQELHDGDVIRVGRQELRFQASGAPTAAAPPQPQPAPLATDPTPIPQRSLRNHNSLNLDQVRGLVERARSGAGPSLPAEIHWIAQDAAGTWWGFEHRPHAGSSGWREMELSSFVKLGRGRPNPNWRNSLQKI